MSKEMIKAMIKDKKSKCRFMNLCETLQDGDAWICAISHESGSVIASPGNYKDYEHIFDALIVNYINETYDLCGFDASLTEKKLRDKIDKIISEWEAEFDN